MKAKKEQYPKELRKKTPNHILLDFKVLKLNIKCITKMIDVGFDDQSSFTKEDYDYFTDKEQLQRFNEQYQNILSKYGVPENPTITETGRTYLHDSKLQKVFMRDVDGKMYDITKK